jgi:hypothetical protein
MGKRNPQLPVLQKDIIAYEGRDPSVQAIIDGEFRPFKRPKVRTDFEALTDELYRKTKEAEKADQRDQRFKNGDIHPITYWREYHGLGTHQFAAIFNIDEMDLIEMEAGNMLVPFNLCKAICKKLELHPTEFYNEKHDIPDSEMVILLLDAYNNPSDYVCSNGELSDDLERNLSDLVSLNCSYTVIKDYYDGFNGIHPKIGQLTKPSEVLKAKEYEFKQSITETLLDNDGHLHFAIHQSPSEWLENQREFHLHNAEKCKRANQNMKSIIGKIDVETYGLTSQYFGSDATVILNKWFAFYLDDRDNHDDQSQNLWSYISQDMIDYGLFDTNYNDVEKLYKKIKILFALSVGYSEREDKIELSKLSAGWIEDILDDLGEDLQFYNARQLILAETNLGKAKSKSDSANWFNAPSIKFRSIKLLDESAQPIIQNSYIAKKLRL